MIESKFNQHTLILESDFFGDIALEDVLDYIIRLKENKEYPRLLKIKMNMINADFDFSVDDLEKIRIENEKALENYDSIIIAMIVDTPKTTMISMFYSEIQKNNKYIFEVFSTDKGASTFLDIY